MEIKGMLLSPVIFLFLLTSCSPLRVADWFRPTPTTDTSKGQNRCPVTETETKFSMLGSVAGQSPVWITSLGEVKWNELPVSLSPYPGRLTKMIVIISKDAEGDLEITGKQIDGNGQVLFPQEAQKQDLASNDGNSVDGSVLVNPQSTWVIPNASTPTRSPNPDGFVTQGGLVYYPNPGCYEYLAKIGGKEVHVILNVVDK